MRRESLFDATTDELTKMTTYRYDDRGDRVRSTVDYDADGTPDLTTTVRYACPESS